MQAMRVGQGKNCSRASAACTSELCTAWRSYKPLPGYYQTTSTQRIYFRECGPGSLGAAPGCLGVATGLRSSAELPVAVSQRWADSLTHCACCACCALRTRRAMGWWFPFRATSVATPPKSPKTPLDALCSVPRGLEVNAVADLPREWRRVGKARGRAALRSGL